MARRGIWADGTSKRCNMRSETRSCVACGRAFAWSYGEQRYFRDHNLQPPNYCKDCLARRKRERDPGMRSEVGPLYAFPPERDQQSPSPSSQSPSPSSQSPDRQLPPPPLVQRPARPPGRSPGAWWGLDLFSIAVFLWLVLVLLTFRIVGWAAALAVVGLGVALAFWSTQRR